MRFHVAALWLASALPSALAVYADDAYHTDYHHALLGIPQQHTTFFHRPQSASKASLLYTLSEKLILGAVNPKDGAIVWRQALASSSNATTGFLRAGENENTVISAVGNEVRAWDALHGTLGWGNEFSNGPIQDLEVVELADGNNAGGAKDAVVLFGEVKGVVKRLKGESGAVIWEYTDESGDIPFQVSTSPSSIYYISLHAALIKGFKIKVTCLDPVTGQFLSQYTLNSDSEVSTKESIIFVGANSASPLIVWSDKASKVLKVNVIGSKQISTINVAANSSEDIEEISVHAPHLINSVSHFLVQFQTAKSHWAEVYHVDLVGSTLSKAYSLPKLGGRGAFSTSTVDANVFFTRHTENEIILVSSISHGVLGRWPVKPLGNAGKLDHEGSLHAVSEVSLRSDTAYAVRSALTLTTGDWELIRNGEPVWLRTESLSGIIAAEWADLLEEEDLTRELEVEGHQNVVAAYIHRVRRHAKDLQFLSAWLRSIPIRVRQSFLGDGSNATPEGLHRDSFGFRKLIIVATENGRLMALDAGDQGNIIWNIKAVELAAGAKWSVSSITVEDSVISVKENGGNLVFVQTLTGQIMKDAIPSSSQLSGNTTLAKAATFVQEEHGQVKGLRSLSDIPESNAAPMWIFLPSNGERIVSLTARPTHDPVASIGKVLGNRSVMYKYLNLNLLLITLVCDTASTATFSLLDAVSGDILYTTTHYGVDISRPITSAMSENWFTYSLWADITNPASASAAKGYQIVVAELFESDMPNDRGTLDARTNYSSIDPSLTSGGSAIPHVILQSFVIPQEISHMTVTQTSQGITSRQLLCTLPSSNSIVAIPRSALDPRRPIGRDQTAAEAEEGLYRYAPVIEFDPRWIISHKREVVGVRKIITSPALLESTSLVFAYGGDVFGTRVAPSMAFDILGNRFGKLQLVGTVLALAVGTLILAPMVRKKQINARWQT
ncbi:MAG: DUF1620 super [Pycnora praestabilis]|nr:MAG: DUF1620 super [Pycnora praestabilis]